MKIKRSDADYFVDITQDVCPMTFVKVRLQIEKMSVNETLYVRLKGAEPLKNVPDSVIELGHIVSGITTEALPGRDNQATAIHRVLIQKK